MTPRAPVLALLPLLFAAAAFAGPPPPPPPAAPTPPAAPAPVAPAATPAAPAPAPVDAWSSATSVGRIVAERPAAARVLERAGIDYCCGGAVSLGDAAKAAGRDVKTLLAELAAVRETPVPANERNWLAAPLPDLLRHIEATHHVYLRAELPRLAPIVEKVRVVHGKNHPELTEVAALFATIARELPPHLELEEQRLFPAILALDAGKPAPAADLLPALSTMESQHDGVGEAFHRLSEITKGYAVPEDACASYRQVLTGLAALEADIHAHVHLENNVLAPRVQALAKK